MVGVVARGYVFYSVVVVIGIICQHHALVAAAIDVVDATLGEVEGGQATHIGSVVAAEEAADVEDAGRGAVGGCGVAIGRIGQGVEWVGDVDVDRGAGHVGTVAATEEGVDLAAEDFDVDILAGHLVAAAEEEADAVVAVVAGPGVAGQDVATEVDRARSVGRGAGHSDMMIRTGTQRAAIVVAAKDGIDGAALEGDAGASVGSAGDESILGAAEDGVDVHIVGVDRDGSLLDGGDVTQLQERIAGGETRGVHLLHTIGESGTGGTRKRGCIVVDVVAIAAAIDRANAETGRGHTFTAGSSTDGDGRAIVAIDGTGNVVAAIDGRNGVAVDDSHYSIAYDVSHTAAAENGTLDAGTRRGGRLSHRRHTRQHGKHKYEKSLHKNSFISVHFISIYLIFVHLFSVSCSFDIF